MASESLFFDVFANDRASGTFRQIADKALLASKGVGELSGKLDKVSGRIATARVGLDGDKEAQHELDTLTAKLITLGRRAANPNISVEGQARALAELSGINLALDKIDGRIAEAKVKVNVDRHSLRGLLSGITGAAVSAGGAPVPLVGSVSVLLPVIAALSAALILATPALIATGIALASFTGFAVLAVPEITKINKAVDKGGAAWKALSPEERKVGNELKTLKGDFHDLQATIEPFALKGFADVLRIVRDLMPAFKPLLKAAGKAIDDFLKNIASWLESPSGKKFVHWLSTVGPQDIANFGKALWGIARAFGEVMLFMYNEGHRGINRIKTLWKFFTVDVPIIWGLLLKQASVVFDRLVIVALGAVRGILDAFGKMPGPLGAPFRRAGAAIGAEMDKWKAKAAGTVLSMQASIDRLHGKRVTITLQAAGGGTVKVSSSVKNAAGFLEFHARGARIPGYGGGDQHLAMLEGGETVVPKHLTPLVAPLMAAHNVPGFALGGFISGVGRATSYAAGKEDIFGRALGQTFSSGILSVFHRLLAAAAAAFGGAFGGGGGKDVVSWIMSALRLTRSPASWLGALETLVSRESGGNPAAVNPISVLGQHATGLWQMLPSTFAAYSLGGSIWDPVAEGVSAIRYIKAVYGSPYNIAGLLGGGTYYGYDRGGWLPPGLSVAYNGTGRPEQVIPARSGGGMTVRVFVDPAVAAVTPDRRLGQHIAQHVLLYTKGGGRLYAPGQTPR